jgi:adenylosuccinate lyase
LWLSNKQQNDDYFKRIECYSPIDGRYRNKTLLWLLFSEEALIKSVLVEIEYFIAFVKCLATIKGVNPNQFYLKKTYIKISTEDALWIKETEKVTNHDVKPWSTLLGCL